MIDIDESSLKSWKQTFAKDNIVYDTDDDYREAINNLVGFFEILIEIDHKIKESDENTTDEGEQMYFIDKDGNKIIL